MKKLFKKKENGDIALIAIFASITILTILALIIDFGLIYFQSARLQNAVDSTTVAVAHNLMAEDSAIKETVEKYMRENGVDIAKEHTGTITSGKLRTTITYGDADDFDTVVTIDKKGLLTEEALDADDGTYITSGYLKVTVKRRCKGYWTAFSGIKDNIIAKAGYAKCSMQYNEMPEALKYTIFANSSVKHDDYRDMALKINGRTNNTQEITNIFVNTINKINEGIIQPIIGWVGGTPNYNTLLNANLSMAVINADVHSNSDISIGVNGLQASRSKDQDFVQGADNNGECVCQSLCTSDTINRYCAVCQANYKKCEGDAQTGDDDYGQVHFTAVNKIDFSAGKIVNSSLIGTVIGSADDLNTRVYVRNYQYVEQTQVALYIINQLDFDKITSTESLRNEYTKTAEEYLKTSINISQSQQENVLNQANNLEYESKNKYKLTGQKSIVYAATNAIANSVMTEIQGGKTLSDFLQNVTDKGIDPTGTTESLTRYDGTNFDYESSTITFTKKDSDQTAELRIIDTENTNRNVYKMLKDAVEINGATEAGYRFAIAKTFKQYSSYIEAPNMKPYFIRAVNRSVRNATTTKNSDSSITQTDSAVSVKDAVKKSQDGLEKTIKSKDTLATVENKDGTFSKSAADSTNDASEVADGQADTYVDNSYKSSDVLTSKSTSPLLKFKLTSTDSSGNSMDYKSYSLTKYKANDSGHTTYNGVNIYDSNGKLNTAKNVVKEYADENGNKYGKNAVQSFAKSDVLVDSDYDDSSVHDYDKHYGDDAVNKKKHYIENTLMLSDDSDFTDSAPAKDSVFLMQTGTKKTYLENKIKAVKDTTGALAQTELEIPTDLRTELVESRYKTLIDATLGNLGYTVEASSGVSYTSSTASISKDYTKPDGTKVSESYLYEDLLPGQDGKTTKTVASILEESRNDFAMTPDDIQKKVDEQYTTGRTAIKQTTGWTHKGSVGKYAADNFLTDGNHRIILEDKCYYDSVDNAWSSGVSPWRYGILVKSGSSVQVDGKFSLDESGGHATTIIGDESDTDKQTYLYVKGNFDVGRCDVYIGDNTTLIVDGYLHVWNNHQLSIGKNARVLVGGNIEIQNGKFIVGENSVVVAKSHIFFKECDTAVTSEIYSDGDIYKYEKAKNGDFNIGGTVYATRALCFQGGSGNINIKENARVFLGRYISTKGAGDITLAENAIVVANRPSDWKAGDETGVVSAISGHKISMKNGSVLVTLPNAPKDNASFNTYHRIDASKYDCESGSTIITDMIKQGNESYSATLANVICDKIDTNELKFANNAHVFATNEIYIQNSKNNVEINPGTKLLLGKNAKGESVSGNSSFNFSADFTAKSDIIAIGATGIINGLASGDYTLYDGSYLSAPGLKIGSLTINQGGGFCVPKDESITVTNLTVNDGASTYIGTLNVTNLTVNKDLSVNKIESAKQITVNSGKLLVETNCTAENISNKSNLTVTNELTVTGTLENNGKVLVGTAQTESNPGQDGSINASGITINNYGTLQVSGTANVGTLNNKYNTAKSAGSVAYVSKSFTVETLNNEKDSKVIANNLICNTSFVNGVNAQVKANNSFTSNGTAENSGAVEIDGNAEFASATNAGDLKMNGNVTFTGKLTNSANVQATSFGATFAEVENNGNISIAGGITANGTFTNNGFVCSNGGCKMSDLQNSGTVSVLSFAGSTNITNNQGATVEIFGSSSAPNSTVSDINNSGDFVSNIVLYYGSITNSGNFECFGMMQGNAITNTKNLYAHSSITTYGKIVNGSADNHDAFIYATGENVSDAVITVYNNNIENYAKLYLNEINLNLSQKFVCYEDSAVYAHGGDITTKDFEINSHCSLKYDGSFNIKETLINKTDLQLTEISAKRIQNEGNLYINSGNRDFVVDYIYNKSGANFVFDSQDKDVIVENAVDNDSILNEGGMYINGDMVAYGTFRTVDGEAYIYGDLDAANSVAASTSYSYKDVSTVLNKTVTVSVTSGVLVEQSAQLYVYGEVPENNLLSGITVDKEPDADSTNAIVSVYGKGGNITIGSVNCLQKNADVYLNYVSVDTNDSVQMIRGNLRIYGTYYCKNDIKLYIEDGATVYFGDNINASSTDVYVLSSGIYCYGKNVNFRSIYSDGSLVYLLSLGRLYAEPNWSTRKYTYKRIGSITLKNSSFMYTPSYIEFPDGVVSKDLTSVFLADTKDLVLNSSILKPGRVIVTQNDVYVTSDVQISNGATLCVKDLYISGLTTQIKNYGNLYVMGHIYFNEVKSDTSKYVEISSSSSIKQFDELIELSSSNAEVFIGATESGSLKFKTELNLYGNQIAYFDNDLIVTDYLGNSEKSKGGVSGSSLVPNRNESIIIEGNSKVCVSGDIFSNGTDNNLGNAVYVGDNASLSCGKNFYADSAIYNFGKFYVFGELVNYKKADGTEASDSRKNASDKKETDRMYEGISLLNGRDTQVNNKRVLSSARFYVGNDKNSTNTILFEGFVQNYGQMNVMQDVYIKGHRVNGSTWLRVVGENDSATYSTRTYTDSGTKYENAPRSSFVAEQCSRANFGGNVAMLGGYMGYNRDSSGSKENMPIFSAEGDATYGMCIFNGGIFYAKGSVGYTGKTGHTKDVDKLGEKDKFSDYYIRHVELFYYSSANAEGDKKGSYSIINGFVLSDGRNSGSCPQNKNALFYSGSGIQVGLSENESNTNNLGGTVQNYGSMYLNGSLTVYSNAEYAINCIGISSQVGSKTVIAGDCWSSGGTVTMRNSLLMCDGDFISKRCSRIGISEKVNSEDDLNSSSYLYVGGNMVTSTLGTGSNGDLGGSYGGVSTWNYLDVFSNASIYVGGSFFTNSIFTPHKNVTLIVDGEDKGKVNTKTNFITWLQTIANNVTLKISGYDPDDFKFIVNNRFDVQQTLREGRTKSMFNRFYIHGSAFLNDRAKISDMTKFYVYGDLVNRTDAVAKITAFEIGRALNTSDDGDTWASKGTFVDENDEPRFVRNSSGNLVQNPDYDYNYANACYVYVQGNLDLDRKVNIYPGTTIRTGRDYSPLGTVKLMHDTAVYAGGKISTHRYIDVGQYAELFARENISAWNYICIREHGTLYSGDDVKCGTSFEAKTSATVFTKGSIKATLSNIKIRDNTKVFCGGNMTALSYIELGKHDENYKDTLREATPKSGDNVCTCTGRCTKDDADGDCPVCKDDYTKCTAPLECICTTKCTEDAVNSECPVCKDKWQSCEAENPDSQEEEICTCTDKKCDQANPDCPVCKNDFSKCQVTNAETTELTNDLLEDYTDPADGGEFYIGRALCSYTGYIRQYGFSSTTVGNYVFANKYVTLRSNADLWVLPEAYNNDTYHYVAPSFESDGTILGNIVKYLKEFSYNLKDKLSFKNGSVYAMGDLTLNKNASLMGTHDMRTFGKTLLCHDSLMYFGHDIKCSTASLKLIDGIKGNGYTGFKASGDIYTTLRCTNKAKHPNGYTIYTKDYDPNKTYTCDKCGAVLSKKTVKENVTCPVTMYANNEIDISTSTDMTLCYMVACNGDVTISDPFYNSSDNDARNLYQLPNAIASYNGNINYSSIYGKISALFYAPVGKVTFDGFYQEIWGSVIGDTVDIKTFYINLHRFSNWRTMDLQIAEAGSVYLISKKEYEEQVNNVDESYMRTGNTEDETAGGASLFFDRDVLNNGTSTGQGAEVDTTN